MIEGGVAPDNKAPDHGVVAYGGRKVDVVERRARLVEARPPAVSIFYRRTKWLLLIIMV